MHSAPSTEASAGRSAVLLRRCRIARYCDGPRLLVGNREVTSPPRLGKITQNENEPSRNQRRSTVMKRFLDQCRGYRQSICLLASGALSEQEEAQIQSHLALCPACRNYFAEIK